MYEVYECTDCKHCASFAEGFRVYCVHPDLPADEVLNYEPVTECANAAKCIQFNQGDPHEFAYQDIEKYEAFCQENYGEIDYPYIRIWLDQQLNNPPAQ